MALVKIERESIAPFDEEAEKRVSELLAFQRQCHGFVPVKSNAQDLFCNSYLVARKQHNEAVDAAEQIILMHNSRKREEGQTPRGHTS